VTKEGVSYLEVKHQLLLSYCTYISFYLLLKASGKPIKSHPVVDQLVRIRTILEKLGPLDKKLSYQIDKLLKQASTGQIAADQEAEYDPRRFKPNPDLLEQDNEENDSSDIYKVPKFAEMHFEEKNSKDKRKEDARQKKIRSSKFFKDIQEEFGDAPEEIGEVGGLPEEEDDDDRHRREYEEDMYMRTVLTKKDKKKQKKKVLTDDISSLMDFGDITVIGNGNSENDLLKKNLIKNSLDEFEKKEEERIQNRKNNKRKVEFDKNDVYSAEEDDSDTGEQNFDFDEELDEIDDMPVSKKESNQGKRPVTNAMKSNRGLTRSRPKDTKTPRTRQRDKYNRAIKKRRGAVRNMSDRSRPYGGETTGIKRNVTRSIKLS